MTEDFTREQPITAAVAAILSCSRAAQLDMLAALVKNAALDVSDYVRLKEWCPLVDSNY